jgi:putative acetyltransferase
LKPPATNLELRLEAPGDVPAIHEVERAAFGRDGEADLVDALRRGGGLALSGVAVWEGVVIGHIAFSPVSIESDGPPAEGLALGPLAVLPAHQRQGVGAALTSWALDECRRQGHRLVFLHGHPEYYPRFGFQPAGRLGFECPFPSPPEVFMVAELQPGALPERGCVVLDQPQRAANSGALVAREPAAADPEDTAALLGLQPAALPGSGGRLRYRPEFDALAAELHP